MITSGSDRETLYALAAMVDREIAEAGRAMSDDSWRIHAREDEVVITATVERRTNVALPVPFPDGPGGAS